MSYSPAQKREMVARYESGLASASHAILVSFKGLTVSQATDLRAKIRENGGSYEVVKNTLALLAEHAIDAVAHITGGGITENIVRVLPEGLGLEIDTQAWQRPVVFDWLQEHGQVSDAEMLRTFNCGIGMIICLPADAAETAVSLLEAEGETVYRIGEITTCDCQAPCVTASVAVM